MPTPATVATCRDGHQWVTQVMGPTCPMCSLPWRRTRHTTMEALQAKKRARELRSDMPCPNVMAFKPYKEDGFTGEEIEITSREQRDALCAEHHLTYDRYSNIRKPDTPPAIDSIDFGDVKDAIERGLPESTELDLPEADIPVDDPEEDPNGQPHIIADL